MTPTPRDMSSAIRFLAMDAIARVGDGQSAMATPAHRWVRPTSARRCSPAT